MKYLNCKRGLICSGLIFGTIGLQAQEKPNIIFVFSDQQSFFELSGNLGGDPVIQTPNLDKLAEGGLQFSNFVSNNPVCVPFRASLLTGKYGKNNGLPYNTTRSVPDGKPGLQPNQPTFSTILKENGYKMAYVGKWHLYPESEDYKVVPTENRFGFTDYWRKSSNYQDRYNTGYYDDSGVFHKLSGYGPSAQMDQLIEFVRSSKDTSFCAVLSWHPPHPSYRQAPEKWVRYYEAADIKFRPNVPDSCRTEKERINLIGAYAHVSALDEEMGRLQDVLKESGIEKNTILIYCSDHGDMMGSHAWYNKRTPWNESVLVPFIISWPEKIKAGRTEKAPLSSVDIAPTLLGFAGIEPPKEMDGKNYSAFITGKNKSAPSSAFIMGITPPKLSEREMEEHSARKKMAYDWRGVYTPKYTYVVRKLNGVTEDWLLFDNQKDPFQLKNLIHDPSRRKTITALNRELAAYLERAGEKDWLNDL